MLSADDEPLGPLAAGGILEHNDAAACRVGGLRHEAVRCAEPDRCSLARPEYGDRVVQAHRNFLTVLVSKWLVPNEANAVRRRSASVGYAELREIVAASEIERRCRIWLDRVLLQFDNALARPRGTDGRDDGQDC